MPAPIEYEHEDEDFSMAETLAWLVQQYKGKHKKLARANRSEKVSATKKERIKAEVKTKARKAARQRMARINAKGFASKVRRPFDWDQKQWEQAKVLGENG